MTKKIFYLLIGFVIISSGLFAQKGGLSLGYRYSDFLLKHGAEIDIYYDFSVVNKIRLTAKLGYMSFFELNERSIIVQNGITSYETKAELVGSLKFALKSNFTSFLLSKQSSLSTNGEVGIYFRTGLPEINNTILYPKYEFAFPIRWNYLTNPNLVNQREYFVELKPSFIPGFPIDNLSSPTYVWPNVWSMVLSIGVDFF